MFRFLISFFVLSFDLLPIYDIQTARNLKKRLDFCKQV
nr:MAG TPA: hypothetical protein [Caudoviricetes sp.]DAT17450.1 MAG TPA: hypothetical protein [Caudoviricetes sp.]DAU00960.1 MAG TPA: hypothetical protein [Caudoviricetes sp.]DAX38633.1 MAG TPA: hypothetical protein [Caudoviricetes sp.]